MTKKVAVIHHVWATILYQSPIGLISTLDGGLYM
jgi:hypothetical protein